MLSELALGIVVLGVDVDAEVVVGHRDHTIRLEARHYDVEEPKADKNYGRNETTGSVNAAKLATDDNAPNDQNDEAGACTDEEHDDGEAKGAGRHEVAPFGVTRVASLEHGAEDPREAKT